ncbi:MAG: type II secretion system GspH family protein [Acidobacteria bacterium]|nr:type II secretion system GspH family protein [Acidobacteriota bacterium]
MDGVFGLGVRLWAAFRAWRNGRDRKAAVEAIWEDVRVVREGARAAEWRSEALMDQRAELIGAEGDQGRRRMKKAWGPKRVAEAGTTLLEVLIALVVLGWALGTAALALGAWQGQYRRAVAAWRCREVLGAVRVQASVGQVACGRPAWEIQGGACRAWVEPAVDCRSVAVQLQVAGLGPHRTYEVVIPIEGLR